jgi:hypothetical protein
MTHPTFEHRVEAIAKLGRVPADRLAVILEEAGIRTFIVERHQTIDEVVKD